MKALLLVAHGSRREASNAEVRDLAARLRGLSREEYGLVDCAFLEIAEPLIPDGIERCIAQGATEVVILPYFLSAGRHVAEDIPRDVAAKQTEHPGVSMRIAPDHGGAEGVVPLLLEAAGR